MKGDYTGYSTQYIDLWVTAQTITIPDFEEDSDFYSIDL